MKVIDSIEAFRALRESWTREGKRVSFVPTMGYLHEGHLSLVDIAQNDADCVVVSIFVNPAQFNNPGDLDSYPRETDRDLKLLEDRGVVAVFLPTPEMMYGEGHQTWVTVDDLTEHYEGSGRPGHFRGVTTVVTLLFNIIQPHSAVFGEKDFQQLRVVERMTADLKLPIDILRGPLFREEDGLAMSSRNVRLDKEAKDKALLINQSLFEARQAFQNGERSSEKLTGILRENFKNLDNTTVDYITVVREDTLEAVETAPDKGGRMLTTVEVHGVRLLDNLALE